MVTGNAWGNSAQENESAEVFEMIPTPYRFESELSAEDVLTTSATV
jgi:hypothetical protein